MLPIMGIILKRPLIVDCKYEEKNLSPPSSFPSYFFSKELVILPVFLNTQNLFPIKLTITEKKVAPTLLQRMSIWYLSWKRKRKYREIPNEARLTRRNFIISIILIRCPA